MDSFCWQLLSVFSILIFLLIIIKTAFAVKPVYGQHKCDVKYLTTPVSISMGNFSMFGYQQEVGTAKVEATASHFAA